MTCSSCGTENRAGRKFCAGCGSALAMSCATCGAANEPGEKFCGECGSPIGVGDAVATGAVGQPATQVASVARPTETVAERRLVTILFADLVGFTPFAEERDAEDVRETLTRYFDLAREVIGRYGGTVEKFIGDAVMAVWGAPVAREDDAERAVRAALDLVAGVRVLGPAVQLRAGVLTGEAAVTVGATNQGIVAGDIVNTASRLQSAAPPGRVLVGESTFRAASKAIAFEEAGEQVLKGKTSPVPGWLALRVVAERGGRGRAGGLEAPFVGRDDELRLLKDMYHASARERRARLVSVIGPGGVGKSRLAWEFEKYLDGIVGTIWWHHGRSPAYGQGISFWALGEMIRGRAGLAETDDEATTRLKIAAMLATHVPEETERRWIEQALLTLLGIGAGDVPADQLLAAWRTFFERLATSGPVVLVFEDLHWADGGLLDFIDHLLEWSREQPIYVLTLARPDLLERRTDWGAGRRNFLSLGLEPLGEPAMRELLSGLVPGLPETIATAIVRRADGIPLYAVETVRMLVSEGRLREEDGVYATVGDLTTLAVPETLTALIGARLDALDPVDRALLQDAAVVGQSFTIPSLAAVSGREAADIEPRLATMVRREILSSRSDARSPERGQFAFVQALIREVSYNTLTKRDRRERHLAAARFFESLGTDELAGALAGHYLAAYQHSPAGPEADGLAIQARLALVGAADRASALGASAQALDFLEQALTIESEVGQQPDLLERAAEQARASGAHERSEVLARRAMDLYVAAGDRPGEARMIGVIGQALMRRLLTAEATDFLAEAIPRFDDLIGRPEHVDLPLRLAAAYWVNDDLVRAVEWADKALDEAERFDIVPSIVDGMIVKGGALGYLGRGYEGISTMRGASALADAHGLQVLMIRAQVNLSDAQISRDPRAAQATARAALDVARRMGRLDYMGVLIANGSYPAYRTGDWDWAVQLCEELDALGVSEVDRAQGTSAAIVIDAARGEDVSDRLALLERVLMAGTDVQAQASVWDTQGNVALAQGRLAEAYEALLTSGGMISWSAPTAYQSAARAALWLKDPARARVALEKLDGTTHGPAITAAHATIATGLTVLEGTAEDAAAAYRENLESWRELGLPLDVALTTIDMAVLLGPSHPGVAAAAETGREILTRLGARTFLAQLSAAMGWGTDAMSEPANRTPSGPRTEPATAPAQGPVSGS